MNILVTAASRQGATIGIAEAIGRALRAHGLETTVAPPDELLDAAPYDAFVIGSAIYAGHWLEPATALVRRFAPTLPQRPVWLFSSGPVGEPSRKLVQKMTADPVELPQLLALTNAREHRIFAGKLTGNGLPGFQRLSLLVFRSMEGDWRDWAAIERWADEIADSLASTRVESTATAS
jgi:menaquinone-dependent protoporphyrinogen oxidase